jgi:enterochelin esterase family protein
MPVTIGIFINPGEFPASEPGGKKRANRSFEYDSLSDQYARFLLEEILPEVGKQYKLTGEAAGRAIGGISSGGICAWTVAWERPTEFSKVLSHVGSFTNIRGGHVYRRWCAPAIGPIRVSWMAGRPGQQARQLPLANQQRRALKLPATITSLSTARGAMATGGALLPSRCWQLERRLPWPRSKRCEH